jgi:type II secretory pathway component PulF
MNSRGEDRDLIEFTYEALTASGTVATGEMTAEDEMALGARLRAQGQYLIHAQARPELATAAPAVKPASRRTDGRVPRKELLAFTEYLWSSVKAGIPILATLEDVEAQLEGKRMRRITAEIREAMTQEGHTLSEALAEHPRAFPQLYIGTVEAGESTGQLDYALEQLMEYLEWQREISLQIRQATLYPAIVVTVMLGFSVLLVTFVYPRLLPIFMSFDIQLPLPTRMVMGTGELLRQQWHLLLGVVVALLLALGLLRRTRRGRLALDTVKLRMPIFGSLLQQIEMSRVVTYMALFYRTGVDLMRGLMLLEQIIVNQRVARAVHHARLAISGGDSIARAFAETRLFPPVVVRSFALGESTGRLDEALDRARSYYAREIPAAVRRMLGALQPLFIVVLGGILAVIALSIFLPIMSIYQAVGR